MSEPLSVSSSNMCNRCIKCCISFSVLTINIFIVILWQDYSDFFLKASNSIDEATWSIVSSVYLMRIDQLFAAGWKLARATLISRPYVSFFMRTCFMCYKLWYECIRDQRVERQACIFDMETELSIHVSQLLWQLCWYNKSFRFCRCDFYRATFN